MGKKKKKTRRRSRGGTATESNIINWVLKTITSENSAYDGTGPPNWVINKRPKDLFVTHLHCVPGGSTIQGVLRIFINNGKEHNDASNNSLIREVTLGPETGTDQTANEATVITLNKWLPAGFRLNCLMDVAGSGTLFIGAWHITAFLGQYSDAVGNHELYMT